MVDLTNMYCVSVEKWTNQNSSRNYCSI